ncbi:PREDICTED: S-adenosylmethionine decarboxylase proenzyme 3-like [Fragaria vesca subsp. vesca]|uniref:S-adenosylmethionine decarboxylase proenzyme 3-like n=1 Tax=Fragaria vesca subsp. vesca TaxID=101020 RepID=UPI0002C37331|nr:PREDICTED: S-adenosylmethionine decarboxylase proenzyme 3-like [Fragaria vesca subsp. vesca]
MTYVYVEVAMTGLSTMKTSMFSNLKFKIGEEMTKAAKIQEMLPGAKIQDSAFVRNGYSMNAIEGLKIFTIHITPKEAFSFASFESGGYDLKSVLEELLLKVLKVVDCLDLEQFFVVIYEYADEKKKEQVNIHKYMNTNISSIPLTEGKLVLLTFKTMMELEF